MLIEGNVVHDVGTDGIRIGDGWGQRRLVERPGGASVAGMVGTKLVGITSAPVRRVTLRNNQLGAIKHAALVVFNAADPARALTCEGNTNDGRPMPGPACAAAAKPATANPPGSSLRCVAR